MTGQPLTEPSKKEWAAIRAALTPQQVERIKAKCEWEQASWLSVYKDWPALFVAVDAHTAAKDGPPNGLSEQSERSKSSFEPEGQP